MPQLSYDDYLAPGQEGQLADNGYGDIVTLSAGANIAQVAQIVLSSVAAATGQVDTWVYDTAADAETLTVDVDGVIVSHLTSGVDKTVTRDAFLAIMLADADFTAIVTPAASGADAITLTAVDITESFLTQETATGTAAASVTTTTPPVFNNLKLTVDGVEISYATASATVTDERDAFLALLQADANLAGVVTFAAQDTDKINITADVPGALFVASLFVGGVNVATFTTTTANQTGAPIPFGRVLAKTAVAGVAALPSATGFKFAGVSILVHTQPNPNAAPDAQLNATGTPQYEAGTPISGLKQGRVYMSPEDDVTDPTTQNVYVRHTAEPGYTGLGRLTPTPGANVDLLEGAEWETTAAADGLCIVNFNRP